MGLYDWLKEDSKAPKYEWDKEKNYEPVQVALDAYKNKQSDGFKYDINGDMLYQQYKDRYITQGRQAMMDAIGQASSMTGGYGNSYAQTVGQQTYQGYLQGLNDKVPELYQLALDKHNQDMQNLLTNYSIEKDKYDTAYGEYNDAYDRAASLYLQDQNEQLSALTERNNELQGQVNAYLNQEVDQAGNPIESGGGSSESDGKSYSDYTVDGFKTRENDNFVISKGENKYKVENHGKVEDSKIIEALRNISTTNGDLITYNGDLYYRYQGAYYKIGARAFSKEYGNLMKNVFPENT